MPGRKQERQQGRTQTPTKSEVEESPGFGGNEKQRLAAEFDEGGRGDVAEFLCSSKSGGEIFGRSFISLAKIVLYSVIFSGCLSCFWGLCLWVFYQTQDNYTPKLQVRTTGIYNMY